MEKTLEQIIKDSIGITVDTTQAAQFLITKEQMKEMLRCAWLDGNAAKKVKEVK